jgi:beta-lactamase superfamily II metal-dependent hydrolase
MLDIEMLPAREGDCLWLRYGDKKGTRQILIDGGRAATAKILKKRFAALPPSEREFELLIITHVDRDHIEGVLKIIEDPRLGVTFKDIWFNGYHHLYNASIQAMGPTQGERLSRALVKQRLPWNKALQGNAVSLRGTQIRKIKVAGGLVLSLLSPDSQKLSDLIPVWKKECRKAGLMAGAKAKPAEMRSRIESLGAPDVEKLALRKFESDPGAPNGSSIAVLAQYKGKSVLLGADAHVDLLIKSIKKLKGSKKRLQADAFKLAHHGSDRNVSKELLELLKCRHYLVSTNGSYFEHPSMTAIARVVKFGGKGLTLHFNYQSAFNKMWSAPKLRNRYGYRVQYPDKSINGTLKVSF